MATPSERRALAFLAGLLLLGGAVRVARAWREAPELDQAARHELRQQIAAVDSARRVAAAARRLRHAGGRRRRRESDSSAREREALRPPPLVDLDRAPAAELERLPRIGPALAKRIVADRDSLGPFGSLEAFQRVRGVGPAMAKVVAPHVTFSSTPRPPRVDQRGFTGRTSRRAVRGTHDASRVP